MPAKRLPWVRLWVESLEHEKVALLSDAEYRTWTMLLLRGSQQPTRWRFASVQHAARVVGRPLAQVKALVGRRLMDLGDDGLWVHDARTWQEVYPSDFAPGECDNAPRRVRGRSVNAPSIKEATLREDSVNAPATLREDSVNAAGTHARDRDRDSESSTPSGVEPAADAPADPAPIAALQAPEPPIRAVPKPKREKAPGHAAVRLYRRATDINPKEGVRQQIEGAVDAEDEDALQRWQRVLQEWLSRGYSSKNVIGLLEWFAEGIPPRKRPSSAAQAGGSSERGYVPNPGPPPVEWDDAKAAASDAERERTRQELIGSGVLHHRQAPPTVNGTAKPPPDPAAAEERLREKERRLLAEGVLTAEQVQTARRARQPSQVTAGA